MTNAPKITKWQSLEVRRMKKKKQTHEDKLFTHDDTIVVVRNLLHYEYDNLCPVAIVSPGVKVSRSFRVHFQCTGYRIFFKAHGNAFEFRKSAFEFSQSTFFKSTSYWLYY